MCCRGIWKAEKGLWLHVKREPRLVQLTVYNLFLQIFVVKVKMLFKHTSAPSLFPPHSFVWIIPDRKERTHLCSPPSLSHLPLCFHHWSISSITSLPLRILCFRFYPSVQSELNPNNLFIRGFIAVWYSLSLSVIGGGWQTFAYVLWGQKQNVWNTSTVFSLNN